MDFVGKVMVWTAEAQRAYDNRGGHQPQGASAGQPIFGGAGKDKMWHLGAPMPLLGQD